MLQFFYRARNKKGFTLIELIIVIAILAILALIAIPAYSQYRQSAENSACESTAKIVYDAALVAASSSAVDDWEDFVTIDGQYTVLPDPITDAVASAALFTVTVTNTNGGTGVYPAP